MFTVRPSMLTVNYTCAQNVTSGINAGDMHAIWIIGSNCCSPDGNSEEIIFGPHGRCPRFLATFREPENQNKKLSSTDWQEVEEMMDGLRKQI
jgi:hypothetical protein